MTRGRIDLKYWLIGLAIFGFLIVSSALLHGDAPFGIVDHQAAGTAERVDMIQMAWREAGLRSLTIASMFVDLVFIAVYTIGSWKAGKSLRALEGRFVITLGWVIMMSAVVFCLSDYLETTLQVVQMLADKGSDSMAATAAFAQPIKVAAWITTFIGVLVAIPAARFSSSAA